MFAAHSLCTCCSCICGWHKNWESNAFACNSEKAELCPPCQLVPPMLRLLLALPSLNLVHLQSVAGWASPRSNACNFFSLVCPWFLHQQHSALSDHCYQHGPQAQLLWGSEYFQLSSPPKSAPMKTNQTLKNKKPKLRNSLVVVFSRCSHFSVQISRALEE